jgi:predicted CXXCH cytochrome family protein
MLVTDQKTLCLKCHAKQAKQTEGAKSVHTAFGAGDCAKCHSPHKANLKALLLAQTPDLCFSCHKDLKTRMEKDKKHQPAEDCLTCHGPHATAEAKLTLQPIAELCGQCHETKDKAFTSAHIGIDPKAVRCMTCHDPHASKDPKFFKASVHPPFAARECDTCHTVSK